MKKQIDITQPLEDLTIDNIKQIKHIRFQVLEDFDGKEYVVIPGSFKRIESDLPFKIFINTK